MTPEHGEPRDPSASVEQPATRLSTKLWIGVLASLAITTLVTTSALVGAQRLLLSEELDHTGQALARTVAAACVEDLLAEDYPALETQFRKTVHDSAHVVHAELSQFFDEELKPVARFPENRDAPGMMSGVRLFRHTVTVGDGGDVLGVVELGLSTRRLDTLVNASTWASALGGLFTMVVLALVIRWVLARSVLGPIAALDSHARRIGAGDLDTPVPITSNDELGRLSSTMESMRRSLSDSRERIDRQVRELEEHDRLKDEFLANTSHELRTPLNGVLGLADSLLDGAYGALPGQIQEPIETIVECGQRLRRMTDSILLFSAMVQAESTDSAPRETRKLAEHVRSCLVDLRIAAERKGLDLLVSVPPELEASYRSSELEELLRVLTDNAIKYTDVGQVEILATRWPQESPIRGFQLAVRDTGVGIPEDLRERVFTPFVQGAGHERRAHGGVGLGLAIASRLAERLGARITLDSEPGRGSCFTVLVPESDDWRLADESPEEAAARLEASRAPWPELSAPVRAGGDLLSSGVIERARRARVSPSKRLRSSEEAIIDPRTQQPYHVVVCDDDPVNLEVLWGALHRVVRVTRTKSGAECLATLRETPAALLLLDIMMPEISGYDVLETLRAEGLLDRLPVIVLSAKTDAESVVKGLFLGARDYLGKPFHREELLRRVRTQLEIVESQARLENEVRAKTRALEAARHANHLKDRFLANMSHEIRTPINGIVGFANLYLCSDASEEAARTEYIENVLSCSESLIEIVDDVLDLAKIESRALEVEPRECDGRAVLSAAVEGHRPTALAKGLELSVDWRPARPIAMRTDPERLRQVLEHLLDNAVKFTSKGGVRVTASEASLGSDSALEIAVADTGVGIDPSRLEDMFQPFRQADMEIDRSFEGTGLGLALARSLARLLGGDVHATSLPGEGSTFTVRVPLRLPESAADSAATATSESEDADRKPRTVDLAT